MCKRYGIDNSRREYHGALLDSEILAEVYLELIGGRQTMLTLSANSGGGEVKTSRARPRSEPLGSRLTGEERTRHREFVTGLGENAIWPSYD